MISGIPKKVIFSSFLFINLIQPSIFSASLKIKPSNNKFTELIRSNTSIKFSPLLTKISESQNELTIQSDTQSEINGVLYAEGNVSVSLGEKLLKADNLIYDKLDKKLVPKEM